MAHDKDELLSALEQALEINKQLLGELLEHGNVAYRQKLVHALREHEEPKNKGGRPIKHTNEIEDDFFTRLELLAKAWGFKGDRWLPSVCKKAILEHGSNSLRRDSQWQKAEIDQLRNRRNKWRNRIKSNAPSSQ